MRDRQKFSKTVFSVFTTAKITAATTTTTTTTTTTQSFPRRESSKVSNSEN